jgi:2-polyprenyl-3-methyl-5-hydroxy-6-metoxy-1,4-benzoquinol methylase
MTAAPTPASKFDDCATEYDALHAESIGASGESTAYFAEYKFSCVERLGLPKSASILDYGCGIGNLTERLVTTFSDVHGFDPSKRSLEVAQKRAPSAHYYESPEGIPQGKFDAIVISCVLHHVPPAARPALVRALHDKLAPNGRLIVFEHNPLNPLTRRAVAICAFDDDAILLWPWEAKRLLANNGFAEIRLDYIVFFPRSLAVLRPLEPKLARLPIGAQVMVVGTRR